MKNVNNVPLVKCVLLFFIGNHLAKCEKQDPDKTPFKGSPTEHPHSVVVNDCLVVSLIYSDSFYVNMYEQVRQAAKKMCGILLLINFDSLFSYNISINLNKCALNTLRGCFVLSTC